MENKKLTKILGFGLLGSLFCFIVIHALTYDVKDIPTEISQIEDLKSTDTLIPKEKSKTQLLEEIEYEKRRKENGADVEYVQPVDLNKFVENGQQTNSSTSNININKPTNQASVNSNQYSNSNIPQNNQSVPKDQNQPYKSDYFNNKNKEEVKREEPTTVPAQQVVNSNPFGLVKGTSSNTSISNGNSKEYFEAQVYGDQKIMNNTALLLRSTEEFSYNNINIPKNSILYGVATFSGNRVNVNVNKVKTSLGEYSVNFLVLDNDRIAGIYDKAPIDETVQNGVEGTNVNSISKDKTIGQQINKLALKTIAAGKDLAKNSRALNLNEGYKLFIKPVIK